MTRISQVVGSIAKMLAVAMAIYAVVLGVGFVGSSLLAIDPFRGCLLFLGSCLLLTVGYAVQTMTQAAGSLGKEVRSAVEELEAFWSEAEAEPQEDWQEWSEADAEHQLLRERMGGCLCPCGSGKPYRLCCGRKN